jgi:hypothetical protein
LDKRTSTAAGPLYSSYVDTPYAGGLTGGAPEWIALLVVREAPAELLRSPLQGVSGSIGRSTYFDARKHHHITRHGHHRSMDAIQKYARDLDPGTRQCLLT